MCTFEPEKPEASVDRGARELPLSPGHDPSKTSSFFACNKRYVKFIRRISISRSLGIPSYRPWRRIWDRREIIIEETAPLGREEGAAEAEKMTAMAIKIPPAPLPILI